MILLAHDAIIAAIISAVIALLGLIISKESKISEFRQEWIDALRNDIARLIAHVHTMRGDTFLRGESGGSSWDAAKPHFLALAEATATINLRLNQDEKESVDLLTAISELVDYVESRKKDFEEFKTLTSNLITASNIVLKQEWTRVKRGELVYRVTLGMTALAIVALCVVLYRASAGHQSIPAHFPFPLTFIL